MNARTIMSKFSPRAGVIILASIGIILVVGTLFLMNSEESKPAHEQQAAAQAQSDAKGALPAEGQALSKSVHPGKMQSVSQSNVAAGQSARDSAVPDSDLVAENYDALLSSTESDVVRQLLAQKIASGELRLPPAKVESAGASSRTTLVGRREAGAKATDRVAGPGRTNVIERTGGNQPSGSGTSAALTPAVGHNASGPAATARRSTPGIRKASGRRSGLKMTGNNNITITRSQPRPIKVEPLEITPPDTKKGKDPKEAEAPNKKAE